MRNVRRTACWMLTFSLILLVSLSCIAAPASIKKSVQALEDGKFLIKLVVTASKTGIYAFELKDPKASIIDVYAPKGWCILSDGELCLSRTTGAPISAGKSYEFVIYSTVSDAQYVWTFFGPLEQIGKPEVL
jgi:hypothetical protein